MDYIYFYAVMIPQAAHTTDACVGEYKTLMPKLKCTSRGKEFLGLYSLPLPQTAVHAADSTLSG